MTDNLIFQALIDAQVLADLVRAFTLALSGVLV